MHPLFQITREDLKTKKSFKKRAKKFGKKKKGSTFAAPKNETGIASKASDDRSEEKEKKEKQRVRAQSIKKFFEHIGKQTTEVNGTLC